MFKKKELWRKRFDVVQIFPPAIWYVRAGPYKLTLKVIKIVVIYRKAFLSCVRS